MLLNVMLENVLKILDSQKAQRLILEGARHGVEKENLRITSSAALAQSKHPMQLGSSLTHPFITTDYSENLLEIVTPPINGTEPLMSWMDNVHTYIYHQLDNELLWSQSMPCPIQSPDEIPVAQYGTSHLGRFRTLYRVGLGHRYEKKMQTIAGIHFNYSLPKTFWEIYPKAHDATEKDLRSTIDNGYLGIARNYFRYGWLIDYLFGASPALDQSFLSHTPKVVLNTYQTKTLYAPYACSLRMSDLGYHNATEKKLNISFNSIEEYAHGLLHAIQTPYPPYQAIFDQYGKDAQINANLLQIEAEYYAPIRPKRVLSKGESQARALLHQGIEYLEVRSIDINPYEPHGINVYQIHFLEIFLLYCLFTDSPLLTTESHRIATKNTQTVVFEGRKKDCTLIYQEKPILLHTWAEAIFQDLYLIADFLDKHTDDKHYYHAVHHFHKRLADPSLLPSAQLLTDLFDQYDSFTELGLALSKQHKDYFLQKTLSPLQQAEFQQLAQESIQKQTLIEAQEMGSFEDFLAKY